MDTIKQTRTYNEGVKLIKIIEDAGFQARFAGGCVRDRYLKQAPKDFDIACSAKPNELMAMLRERGIKVVPTGIDHGTVTVVTKFAAFEVTSLRKDLATDGRHAEVEFGSSFEEDSMRRDFTCNAMYEDHLGKVYDFHSGKKHLDEGILRFVGDPAARIKEDYLRILRLFRFWARLSCAPDQATLKVVSELASGLAKISQERITHELFGLLECGEIEEPLHALFQNQIMVIILPDARPLTREEIEATQVVLPKWRALVRLSLLIKQVKDAAHIESLGRKLKLSRQQIKSLLAFNIWGQALGSVPATQANFMALIDQCEEISDGFFLEALIPCWQMLYPEFRDIIKRAKITEETKRYLRKSPLPIVSQELMLQLNLAPGPELGELKKKLIESYRNEEWHTKEEGMKWLEKK